MGETVVCSVEDLDVGERIIKEIQDREIAVFNVDGEYRAVANYCVHAGGPICEGALTGMVTAEPNEWEYDWEREGEILSCPWHGWEFDILDGACLTDERKRLITYDVWVKNDQVVVGI